jgi:DNA-binding XRE family transcriptional regulator
MPVHPSSFAGKLQGLREAAGLSQYALAKRSGLSKQALSQLELGQREPSWATVQSIAGALGVSCMEFIDPDIYGRAQRGEVPRPRGRPAKAAGLGPRKLARRKGKGE